MCDRRGILAYVLSPSQYSVCVHAYRRILCVIALSSCFPRGVGVGVGWVGVGQHTGSYHGYSV